MQRFESEAPQNFDLLKSKVIYTRVGERPEPVPRKVRERAMIEWVAGVTVS